jgi:hypothetical protein
LEKNIGNKDKHNQIKAVNQKTNQNKKKERKIIKID